jgi:TolB-like protein
VNTSGDSTQNFLADGVTDGLAVALSQIGSLKVVALQDSASLGDLRRLHGVRAVVRGSVSRSGDTVRVEARLLDAGSRGTLWEDQVAAPLGKLPQHHGSMAVAISRALRAELRRDERARLATAGEIDRVAYEAFLRGRFALEQGELELARGQFERAATIAPAWAPPHVGLANYWTSLSFFSDLPPADVLPRARDEVTRALELDQNLAEAHAVLGYLRAYYEWDWRAAAVAYRRALALQPSN